MVFSRIAKFFLEYEFDEIVRKKQDNNKRIETVAEDCLVFNELIIMSQMMINLVNFDHAKK